MPRSEQVRTVVPCNTCKLLDFYVYLEPDGTTFTVECQNCKRQGMKVMTESISKAAPVAIPSGQTQQPDASMD